MTMSGRPARPNYFFLASDRAPVGSKPTRKDLAGRKPARVKRKSHRHHKIKPKDQLRVPHSTLSNSLPLLEQTARALRKLSLLCLPVMMAMRTPRSSLLRSLLPVIVLLLVLDPSLAHGAHSHHHEEDPQHRSLGTGTSHYGERHGRKCGTHDPSDARIARSNEVAHKWLQAKGGRRALQDDPIVLPICFHVIRPDENNPDFLNTESLQVQLDALNLSFSSHSCCDTSQPWCNAGDCSIETGIRFELALLDPTDGSWVQGSTTPNVADANACATRTVNADWYSSFTESSTELNLKRTLRVGDASVLNVYFKTNNEGILGYATFPDEFTVAGDIDGVIINDATVIGGSSVEYDEGVSKERLLVVALYVVTVLRPKPHPSGYSFVATATTTTTAGHPHPRGGPLARLVSICTRLTTSRAMVLVALLAF